MEEPATPPVAPAPKPSSTPRRELRVELGILRKNLKEAARACLQRLDTELVHLIDSTKGEDADMLTHETARVLLAEIKALQLKPEKGRRKDLKAIERFIERAREVMSQDSKHVIPE